MHMANVDVSVIIPCKNSRSKTAGIIKKFSQENDGLTLEFIIIDMNSNDGTVLESLSLIKELGLLGYVIQSGSGTVPAALNTGIFRSSGKYVTFVYPTRLYKDYLQSYFAEAEKREADFVFAAPKSDPPQKNIVPVGMTGTDLAVSLIHSSVVMDFAAVLYRREFLTGNGIRFYEDCTNGYAEAFIFSSLMYLPVVANADIDIERDYLGSSIVDESKMVSKNCFERLDAMIHVYVTARMRFKDDKVLLSLLRYQKLPSVALGCVDKLLSEGFGSSAIKKQMSVKGYDKYIDYSADTPYDLKMKIITWKLLPFAYKP